MNEVIALFRISTAAMHFYEQGPGIGAFKLVVDGRAGRGIIPVHAKADALLLSYTNSPVLTDLVS
ncbi:hypothetical protein DPSP01_000944 [Paraphaeosphaeria sporulosa]|uniref:Uncharacterized protein n=1 Tax=Paraphaeosphaeria sporulosa TaxID=1460663 RepID=A0A177C453_9PLEO|nr:uncharacterized protein CC84DRAFT_1167310 [Paraphaeosphaeria sporulosa]OAG02186.1 hypothetical protein CC84DRAFT_1167310 [Paraphaeosphaeria sporulosa]